MNGDNQEPANRALVRRLVDEVINANHPEILPDIFAPELVEPVRDAFETFRAAFPDWRETVVEMIAGGEQIAVRLKCRGILRGTFMGIEPNGRRQEVDEVFFLRIVDGRIVNYWGLEDNLKRLEQLGSPG